MSSKAPIIRLEYKMTLLAEFTGVFDFLFVFVVGCISAADLAAKSIALEPMDAFAFVFDLAAFDASVFFVAHFLFFVSVIN